MKLIRKCVEEGECEITLYGLEGCDACTNMQDKLDSLNIPYNKKDITKRVISDTKLNSVPQVIINTPIARYVIQDPSKLDELLGEK